jgi:hypothetical protein
MTIGNWQDPPPNSSVAEPSALVPGQGVVAGLLGGEEGLVGAVIGGISNASRRRAWHDREKAKSSP